MNKQLEYFRYFYERLSYRVFVAIGLSVTVGVLDGFGLAMFLPLLELVSGGDGTNADLGTLSFLPEMIESVGLTLNLFSVLIFMCLFFVLKGLARFANDSYYVRLQQFFVSSIRIDLVRNFSAISYKAYIGSDIGRIQNTFTGEVLRLVNAYRGYFAALQYLVMVFVYMGFAFFVNSQFAVLVAIGGALTNFIYKRIYKKTKKSSYSVSQLSNRFEGFLIQLVTNFKYLKATHLLKRYDARLETTIHDVEKEVRNIGMLNAIVQAAREPILIIVVCSIIMIQNGVMNEPLGPILVSLLFFYRALSFLMLMQNNWNKFLGSSGSLRNMTEFLGVLKEGKDSSGTKPFTQFNQSLVFDDISWQYSETRVLDELSLEIKKYDTVAFVGESGSGKTTLINILAGLLKPQNGKYLVDGDNVEELDLSGLQSRVGYITQESVIFNDTLFNNITFWAERTAENEQKVWEVLKKVALAEFTSEQPEGLETVLGNNGVNLSGGQKQRVSIARELYKDIDILIMDEATSALDSKTELLIQQNIEALKGQYTVIVVAHRLSTIKNFDRIYLMDKGKILDHGSFEALKTSSPSFKRMVELQGV